VKKGEQQRRVVDGLFKISEPISEILEPLCEFKHRKIALS